MRLPSIFLPGRDLKEKIEHLKSGQNLKQTRLENLILDNKQGFSDFGYYHEIIPDDILDDIFDFMDKSEIVGGVYVDYNSSFIEIVEFESSKVLDKNIGNMVSCAVDVNNEPYRVNLLIKDAYAVFVYTPKSDYKCKDRFIDKYKEMGFKEILEKNN